MVEPGSVTAFLAPLPVNRIWGVGKRGEKRLQDLGIHTIGQLAATPAQFLSDHFGEAGRQIWDIPTH